MEKKLHHLAIWDGQVTPMSRIFMIAGFAGIVPSTVPPEQPLFNGIAEMSRRSQT